MTWGDINAEAALEAWLALLRRLTSSLRWLLPEGFCHDRAAFSLSNVKISKVDGHCGSNGRAVVGETDDGQAGTPGGRGSFLTLRSMALAAGSSASFFTM